MIYITGVNGQLGSEIYKDLAKQSIDCIGLTRQDFDLTDYDAMKLYFNDKKVEGIIHCAAYTKVDDAEDHNDLCYTNNVVATHNLIEICKVKNAKFVFISSDYVFDGTKEDLYLEDDKTNPINYYGYTKKFSEEEVKSRLSKYYIVRVTWLFGNGNNFIKTISKLMNTKESLSIVDDQIGSPSYSVDIAKNVIEIYDSNHYGTYHIGNEGYCSWFDLANYIKTVKNSTCIINPLKTKDYKYKANRPLNSRLSKEKAKQLGIKTLPHWQDAVSRYLITLETEK